MPSSEPEVVGTNASDTKRSDSSSSTESWTPDVLQRYAEDNPITSVLSALLSSVYLLQWRLTDLGYWKLEFWAFHIQGWTEPHLLSILTSTVGHLNLIHLAGSLAALLVMGPAVERHLGEGWYLLFFLGAGGLAGGLQVSISGGSALGASGALSAFFAIWAAYRVPEGSSWSPGGGLFGSHRHLAWLLLLGFPGAVALQMWGVGWGAESNLGHVAHLAGYMVGIGAILALSLRGDPPPLRD